MNWSQGYRLLFSWLVVVQIGLTGCFPRSWTEPISSFPATAVPDRGLEVSSQVLVLPFWQEYRDTKCRFSFFFAPPVLLQAEELPALSGRLHSYKNKATVYLFAHPTWRLSPGLLGVYIFYPEGRIVWAGNPPRNAWSVFQAAHISSRWKQSLLAGLRSGELVFSKHTALDGFYKVPEDTLRQGACGTDSLYPCCYESRIEFRFDNEGEALEAIDYLDRVPVSDDTTVEVWK